MEFDTENPETESLFIAVKKPGTKPAWSGNPNLEQPIKTGIRGLLTYEKLNLEFFGTQVWNYNNLVSKKVNELNFLTFENIDALILGTNLSFTNEFIEFGTSYTWAKNKTKNIPLAEVAPLSIRTKLISPKLYNLIAFVKHTYNDSQLRIDETLNETTTSAWNKIDLGISYLWQSLSVSFEVENLLNSNYYQHLSYMRDPFASGSRVFEPGTTFRVTFKTNQLF
jgi:iron complex outermembrane receptor protein